MTFCPEGEKAIPKGIECFFRETSWRQKALPFVASLKKVVQPLSNQA